MSESKYLRALINAHRAFADTLEAELANDVEVPAPPPSPAPSRPRKPVRAPYRPSGPVSEVDAQRADDALRRANIFPMVKR